MRKLVLAAAALALVAGCTNDRPKLPSMPAAFATIPLPPYPEYIGQAGSEDALMFTFRSTMGSDSVTAYYQDLFKKDSTYHVVSDNQGGIGEHAFYVEVRKRPLWIRIRPEAGNEGTIVELTGAVVSAADTARDTVSHAPGARTDTTHAPSH